MAPKPKVGKFAKKTYAGRKRMQTLPGMINSKSVAKAVGEAITGMTEAQYKKGRTAKPLMIALMPHAAVKQPPPYKANTYKK